MIILILNKVKVKMIMINLNKNLIYKIYNNWIIQLIIINVWINKEHNMIQFIYNHNLKVMNNIRIR